MPAAKDNDAASRASETTPSMTLLVHEAAAIINLHAQAVIVQNIRSLVPLILDLKSSNYTRRRESFLMAGKYSL